MIWKACFWTWFEKLVNIMCRYLQAELLKQKHRFNVKLLWLSPLTIIGLVLSLMAGSYLVSGAFNWWYTLMLPATISIIIAATVSMEKKHNRHTLFCIVVDKRKLWIAQILMNTIFLFILNMIFFIMVVAIGKSLGVSVPFLQCFMASFVLFLTFAWQIPVLMFFCENIGSFPTIIISLFLNIGVGIFCATERYWYVPFSIPARLMCPILNVLPNGLPVEIGNPMGDSSVVPMGISITIVLFFVFSYLTTSWFEHREVK